MEYNVIKWQSKFNIPDSTIQCAEVFIKVKNFKNIGETCKVQFEMTDGQKVQLNEELVDLVVKSYEKTFDRVFNIVDEIYIAELESYMDAEII